MITGYPFKFLDCQTLLYLFVSDFTTRNMSAEKLLKKGCRHDRLLSETRYSYGINLYIMIKTYS